MEMVDSDEDSEDKNELADQTVHYSLHPLVHGQAAALLKEDPDNEPNWGLSRQGHASKVPRQAQRVVRPSRYRIRSISRTEKGSQ